MAKGGIKVQCKMGHNRTNRGRRISEAGRNGKRSNAQKETQKGECRKPVFPVYEGGGDATFKSLRREAA